jgi:hypothetical protein
MPISNHNVNDNVSNDNVSNDNVSSDNVNGNVNGNVNDVHAFDSPSASDSSSLSAYLHRYQKENAQNEQSENESNPRRICIVIRRRMPRINKVRKKKNESNPN